jgi:hypothetical protein
MAGLILEETLIGAVYDAREIMNQKRALFHRKATLLTAAIGVTASAYAGFQYTARDLVFGFRTDGGGTPEVTINAGQVSTYYSLPVGQTITVSNINTAILLAAFPDLNNLSWSAAADVRTTGDATYPIETDWVTAPRTDLNTQSTPWSVNSRFTQANPNAKIDGIAGNADLGAVSYGNQVPTGPTNSSTAVVIPEGVVPYAYSYFMGANGNYSATFPGSVETQTGPNFTTGGQPVRADFYQRVPNSGGGPATYLGYFEFSPSGAMTYHSGPSQSTTVPRPTITAVTRVGTTTTVSFTTVSGGQYSLRYTNSAGLMAPVSTWPTSSSPISGNGSINSIPDVTGDDQRYYSISAH